MNGPIYSEPSADEQFKANMERTVAEQYALSVAEVVAGGSWSVLRHWSLIRTWAREAIRHRDQWHALIDPERLEVAHPRPATDAQHEGGN